MKTYRFLLFVSFLIIMSSLVSATLNINDVVLYWSLDNADLNSGNPIDLGTRSNNGTNSGNVTTGVAGQINEAFDYDATNSYTYINGNMFATAGGGKRASMSAWVKTDLLGGDTWQVIMGSQDSSGAKYDYVIDGTPGTLRFCIEGTCTSMGSDFNIDDGNWHHIIASTGGTVAKFYVDGVLRYSFANTATLSSGTAFIVADDIIPGSANYADIIDEIVIFNETLTDGVCSLNNVCGGQIAELYNNGTGLQYPFVSINISYFNIIAKSFWDNSEIVIFNATVDGVEYSTINGTINTNLLSNSSLLHNITVFSSDRFTSVYNAYNVSTNLIASLKQTDITLNFKFNNGDQILTPINFTRLDTGLSIVIYNGTTHIFPDAPNQTFEVRCNNDIFAPFNLTLSLTPLENNTYNFTVNETPTFLTFKDAKTNNAISNATITITFPSGDSVSRITNSNGLINFSYILNDVVEFGLYTIKFDKIGYLNLTFTETINQSNIPFSKTYNISRAKLNIFIYDRQNGLLSVPVEVAMIGVFNKTTNNGTLSIDNLTIMGGEYTVYASADGYKTETRTFTYTNQEVLNINFYLLNLSISNLGILTVNTLDSFYRTISGAKIELLQYVPESDSYISVSECISNVNAQCFFNVELNTKIYYISGLAIVNGVLLSASTSMDGEIFTSVSEIRNLVFYTKTDFQVEPINNIIYTITESFLLNVSEISVDFYSFDGGAYTVCIEYFKKVNSQFVSQTNDTYCITSTSALQNINTQITLNRTNTYKAEVYVKQSNHNILLARYDYPSVSTASELFKTGGIIGAIIIILWLFILGFSMSSSNMVLFFVLAIVLAWVQWIIFPLQSMVSFAVFKTLIASISLLVARKKRDFQ